MKVELPKGKYVVAVSGGVDSAVLLDLVSKIGKVKLVIAHFDHGIRKGSTADARFVEELAKKYGYPLEIGYGRLGPKASEDTARQARYKFLNLVKKKHKADAIITAHHEDDFIETAFINLLRGSGRRGLTAIYQNPSICRPLLRYSKKQILSYANKHNLKWREDPTNQDPKYLRNYVRANIVSGLPDYQRKEILKNLNNLAMQNRLIDENIKNLSKKIMNDNKIARAKFTALPDDLSKEVLMHFFRLHRILDFDKKTIERLVPVIKTGKANTRHNVNKRFYIRLSAISATLETPAN